MDNEEKARLKSLTEPLHYDPVHGLLPEIRRRLGTVEPERPPPEEEEDDDEDRVWLESEWLWPEAQSCSICAGDGRVLCCERCPASFHLVCIGLTKDPPGKFLCNRCSHMPDGVTLFKPEDNKMSSEPQFRISNEKQRNWETFQFQYQRLSDEAFAADPNREKPMYPFMDKPFLEASGMLNPVEFEPPAEFFEEFAKTEPDPGDVRPTPRKIIRNKICFQCNKKDNFSAMLQCDFCDKIWHQNCVYPMLYLLPRETYWRCPKHPESACEKMFGDTKSSEEKKKIVERLKNVTEDDYPSIFEECCEKLRKERMDAALLEEANKPIVVYEPKPVDIQLPMSSMFVDTTAPPNKRGRPKKKTFVPLSTKYKLNLSDIRRSHSLPPSKPENKAKAEIDRDVAYTEDDLISSITSHEAGKLNEKTRKKIKAIDFEAYRARKAKHDKMRAIATKIYNDEPELVRNEMARIRAKSGPLTPSQKSYLHINDLATGASLDSGFDLTVFGRNVKPLRGSDLLHPNDLRGIAMTSRLVPLGGGVFKSRPMPKDLSELRVYGYTLHFDTPEERDSYYVPSMSPFSKEPISYICRPRDPDNTAVESTALEKRRNSESGDGDKHGTRKKIRFTSLKQQRAEEDHSDDDEPLSDDIDDSTQSLHKRSKIEGLGDSDATVTHSNNLLKKSTKKLGASKRQAQTDDDKGKNQPQVRADQESVLAPNASSVPDALSGALQQIDALEKWSNVLQPVVRDTAQPRKRKQDKAKIGRVAPTTEGIHERTPIARHAGATRIGATITGVTGEAQMDANNLGTQEGAPITELARVPPGGGVPNFGHLGAARIGAPITGDAEGTQGNAPSSGQDGGPPGEGPPIPGHVEGTQTQAFNNLLSQLGFPKQSHQPPGANLLEGGVPNFMQFNSFQLPFPRINALGTSGSVPLFPFQLPGANSNGGRPTSSVSSHPFHLPPANIHGEGNSGTVPSHPFHLPPADIHREGSSGSGPSHPLRPPSININGEGTSNSVPLFPWQLSGTNSHGEGTSTPVRPRPFKTPSNKVGGASSKSAPREDSSDDEDLPIEEVRKQVALAKKKVMTAMFEKKKLEYANFRDNAIQNWTAEDFAKLNEEIVRARQESLFPHEPRYYMTQARVLAKLDFGSNYVPIAIQRGHTIIGAHKNCHVLIKTYAPHCSDFADEHCDIVMSMHSGDYCLSTMGDNIVIVDDVVLQRPSKEPSMFKPAAVEFRCSCRENTDQLIEHQKNRGTINSTGVARLFDGSKVTIGCCTFTFVLDKR